MSKTIKAAATPATKPEAVKGHRVEAVGVLINEAGQAAGTMLAKCREAAREAAKQLNPATPMQQRIADVVGLYSADFTAAGHNVRSLFVDALTLHACAQTPVMITAVGKDGKKVDTPVTAADAVNMSKHAMKDAVKQVRDAHGIGRKAGAGRKPAAKAKAPAAPAAPDMRTDVDAFSAWLDNLTEYLSDSVYHPKIVARLIENGYTLGKAAKGRAIKGKAAA